MTVNDSEDAEDEGPPERGLNFWLLIYSVAFPLVLTAVFGIAFMLVDDESIFELPSYYAAFLSGMYSFPSPFSLLAALGIGLRLEGKMDREAKEPVFIGIAVLIFLWFCIKPIAYSVPGVSDKYERVSLHWSSAEDDYWMERE